MDGYRVLRRSRRVELAEGAWAELAEWTPMSRLEVRRILYGHPQFADVVAGRASGFVLPVGEAAARAVELLVLDWNLTDQDGQPLPRRLELLPAELQEVLLREIFAGEPDFAFILPLIGVQAERTEPTTEELFRPGAVADGVGGTGLGGG